MEPKQVACSYKYALDEEQQQKMRHFLVMLTTYWDAAKESGVIAPDVSAFINAYTEEFGNGTRRMSTRRQTTC